MTTVTTSVRRCRVCGCTDAHACPGGCYWVAPDLCSACAMKAATKRLRNTFRMLSVADARKGGGNP